jgi:hypothetical protein
MPQLEIIATDGRVQKRILWLDVTPNGIYAGWFSVEPNHISYHTDGNFFLTSGDSIKKIATFHELRKFKGIQQLASAGFSSNILEISTHLPEYKMKKLRSVAYIDVRKFMHDPLFGCLVCALEPNRFDLLTTQRGMSITEIHVFYEFYP